jgi:peptidoglycan/LPS O-acetylase OafA/YrhL
MAILGICLLSIIAFGYIGSRLAPRLVTDSHQGSEWLDGLRGLAAAMVALNHTPLIFIIAKIAPRTFYFPNEAGPIFGTFGSLGVQIFLCITGSLFAKKLLFSKKVDWSDFFRRRILRIVPAYTVAVTLAMLVAALFEDFRGPSNTHDWASMPSLYSFSLIPTPTIGGFDFSRLLGITWSLSVEWKFYLALPLLFVVSRPAPGLFLIGIAAFAIVDLWLTSLSSWSFFVIGALAFPLMKKIPGRVLIASSAMAFLVGTYVVYAGIGANEDYGLMRFVAVAMIYGSLSALRPSFLASRPMVAIGTLSYSFYLLHTIVIFSCFSFYNQTIGDVGNLSAMPFAALSAASIMMCVLVSSGSYFLVERRFMHRQKLDANARTTRPALASKTS